MGVLHMTEEGYVKLKDKIDYLKRVKRKEITDSLVHARSFGDLSENAEYSAAKEAQNLNEIKIRELEEQFSKARIVNESALPAGKVCIGSKVRILDINEKEELEYTLVSEVEANYAENRISISSPVGKGLIGRAENEVVDIKIPAGVLRYKILKISR
jgi:transcription elongation factor GreA